MARVKTGIKGLDPIIEGGFPENTVTLVSGSPGAGKTLFALSFLLEGARNGEKCCYITFSEGKNELIRAAKGIESLKDVEKYVDKTLMIQNIKLEDINLARFMQIIMNYPVIDRLVVDSTNKLFLFSEDDKKYRMVLNNTIEYLKNKAKCSILIHEESNDGNHGLVEAFESDGEIKISFLDMDEKPRRVLEILKMRYTEFDPRVAHDLVISKKDMKISKAKIY